MTRTARQIIDTLSLEPHPEGGWYRETWRAPAAAGERASATAIHFLLESGQSPHWHKVDATEIWLWHVGDALELSLADGAKGPVSTVALGGDILAGHSAQHIVEPHQWQAARPLGTAHGFVLVSCIVSPGFEFSGFELAEPGWSPA